MMSSLGGSEKMATDDACFSTGTGLERVGDVGPDQDYWRAVL